MVKTPVVSSPKIIKNPQPISRNAEVKEYPDCLAM